MACRDDRCTDNIKAEKLSQIFPNQFCLLTGKEHQVDTNEHDTCAILDDTTFQKNGIRIEGVSKVFDHVTHNFIYGMKCLTLALFDGKSCYPIDFSLHREKGKKKDYGLTLKQRKEQFKEKRNAKTLGHRGHIQGMPRLSWTGKMSDSEDYAMPDLD